MSGDPALTPAAFNAELRAWVKNVTGKSIGDIPGYTRATAYRITQGDTLLPLADLIRIVIECAPKHLSDADKGSWIQERCASWQARWSQAEQTMRVQQFAADRTTSDDAPSPTLSSGERPLPPGTPDAATTPGTPWSHRSGAIQLPRATVSDLRAGYGPEPRALMELLDSWMEAENSNLFVVSGPSGSGKTTEAKFWISEHPSISYFSLLDGPLQGELNRLAGGDSRLVIVDDFDPISSRDDEAAARPDLSQLRTFVAHGGRCVVLCKRNPLTEIDELAEQLRNSTRLEGLGIINPVVVRVLPLAQEALEGLASARNDTKLTQLAEILSQSSGMQLANPMILRQLYETLGDTAPIPKTQWEAYNIYVNHICGLAWDRSTSRIPGRLRFRVHRDLAWDIFAGLDHSVARRRLAVSLARVAERVQENVQRDATLTRLKDYLTYEWTADFLSVSDIFGTTLTRPSDDTESARFTHSSYYEFFVAEAIRATLGNERPLALDHARFAEAAMDSLIVSFLKASLEDDDYEAIRALCLRDSLSWLDRLLCLYLMEERPGFRSLIEAAPRDYWAHVERGPELFESLFLRKATMYQLVIAGRLPASVYVELLRQEEQPRDEALERHLLGTSAELTASLMMRLVNPELREAMPISLYRIGQMGDTSCIPQLKQLAKNDPTSEQEILHVIEQIEERNAADTRH